MLWMKESVCSYETSGQMHSALTDLTLQSYIAISLKAKECLGTVSCQKIHCYFSGEIPGKKVDFLGYYLGTINCFNICSV